VKTVVGLGEVLLRISPQGPLRLIQSVPGPLQCCVAGAEANTMASIAHFGGRARLVTSLPDNALAEGCVSHLRGLGVDVSCVVRPAAGRMGVMFLEPGVGQRASQVLYDREHSAFSATPPEDYNWDAIFADADWLHVSGISGALSSVAEKTARHALEQAAARGCSVSFDPNFRSKLWRWDPGTEPRVLAARVLREWLPFVTVFFGGLEDIALVSGIEPAPGARDAWLDAARQLTARHPNVRQVVGTSRAGISASEDRWSARLWDAESGEFLEAPERAGRIEPFEITPVVDRIGAGDAFAAGLIFATRTPALSGLRTRLEFATAAGCFSHWVHGDINYATRAEVEALMGGARGGRVNR
jgi:2-dehydro-3-deoxygluconokinase